MIKKEYECQICFNRYDYKSDIQEHMMIHHVDERKVKFNGFKKKG
jgi:hypothetical protein